MISKYKHKNEARRYRANIYFAWFVYAKTIDPNLGRSGVSLHYSSSVTKCIFKAGMNNESTSMTSILDFSLKTDCHHDAKVVVIAGTIIGPNL